MKTIVILLDGLGDRTHAELSGMTPLEAAKTPNLDRLSKIGQTGIMVPFRQGVPLGTEMAHFLLFGYGAEEYPGRTIIDAIGEDLDIESGSIYFRTSWAWTEEYEGGYLLKDRFTQDLSRHEALELSKSLPKSFDGCRFEWIFSYDSHGFLKVTGDGLSSMVSDSDPFYREQFVMRIEPFETEEQSAMRTADVMNRYLLKCSSILYDHDINKRRIEKGLQPANFLMTKWAGENVHIEGFEDRNGMKGAIIGSSKLMKGLAGLLDMDYVKSAILKESIDIALQGDWDYVHVHTKAPDEAAHTKNPHNKVRAIEEIDSQVGELCGLDEDVLLVVTADHSTPSNGILIHSGEPVPIMFIGKGLRTDSVESFSERACACGSIRMNGSDLIPMILNSTDRAKLYHLRAGRKKRLYTPSHVNRLTRYE
ncbi:2,3-bisphosphoglycerate-independent phosphoglycerate mutase [Peptoclostridium litorale DSM 5388]|uniref:2,3-bisphosphoglycerate-independent phosphoglycerate mutase 2 n=1 Tax=Peptoclostridium litorale DSM 5388 TaxID=1121324 RepID=A0A069RH03_PEPLI|nr:alkaline phosphatase family protein [Peptoclostridium litorale]KDR96286.1 2,3-bisphosphoglycerate-independent phosphoglycerate mutase 2 [Peptoclostridium litorale DSM 5388]SIO15206.1 2,3-bisphosphoglycerate-independent phosphoglycerate mutase [Peptoclostridium litorale DSM 5388]